MKGIVAFMRGEGYRLILRPNGQVRIEPCPPDDLVLVLRKHKRSIVEALKREQASPVSSLECGKGYGTTEGSALPVIDAARKPHDVRARLGE